MFFSFHGLVSLNPIDLNSLLILCSHTIHIVFYFLIIPSIYEDYFASPNDFAIIFSFRIIPDEKIIAEKLGEAEKRSYINV